jgi:hypothetical protein
MRCSDLHCSAPPKSDALPASSATSPDPSPTRPEQSARIEQSLTPAEALVDAAASLGDRFGTIPELTTLLCRDAFRDLGPQILAI